MGDDEIREKNFLFSLLAWWLVVTRKWPRLRRHHHQLDLAESDCVHDNISVHAKIAGMTKP